MDEDQQDGEGLGTEGESPFTGKHGMGGRPAAQGFAFQARYIVARIPAFLDDPTFEKLLHEGAEDVDIRFLVDGTVQLEAVQVKAYEVGKRHLVEILEHFASIDQETSKAYKRFVVACASLHPRLRPLNSKLERYRGVEPFVEGTQAITTTLEELKTDIKKLGLSEHETLIIEKFSFDTNTQVQEDRFARNYFTVELQKLDNYTQEPISKLERVYEKLQHVISNSMWKELDRSAIELEIHNALRATYPLPLRVRQRKRKDVSCFVNRDDELNAFCKMLEPSQPQIMIVSGHEGLGKSELIEKMLHHCDDLKLGNSVIVWSNTRAQDYEDIMCNVRNELGGEYFWEFSTLKDSVEQNDYWKPRETDSLATSENEKNRNAALKRLAELTEAFIPGLARATEERKAVLFFDEAHRMTKETNSWIWGELFHAAYAGQLPNVRFVMCTEADPAEIKQIVDAWRDFKLQPFNLEHITTYVTMHSNKMGSVSTNEAIIMARAIHELTNRSPLEVAVAYKKIMGGRS